MVHEIGEIQYQFADAKIDWFTLWWLSRFIRYCTLNSSYCKKRYIFCLIVWQTLISINKSTRLPFKICWKRVAQNFLWIILIWLKKKRLRHRCFPVNFAKFLRTSFLQNTSGRLRLLLFFLKNKELVYFFFRVSSANN